MNHARDHPRCVCAVARGIRRARQASPRYIKAVRSDEVALRYPGAPRLEPGRQVFALHAADGTPIAIAGTREQAIAGAASNALETVSLH